MLELARFAILVIGFTYLITESAVFTLFRVAMINRSGANPWVITFLYCPACVAFWVGFAVQGCGLYPWDAVLTEGAIAGLAIGAMYKKMFGSPESFTVEAPLWGGVLNDEKTEKENV